MAHPLKHLYETIRREQWQTSIIAGGAIDGGSMQEVRETGAIASRFDRILAAFPRDVIEEIDAEERREKAEALRAEADALEGG